MGKVKELYKAYLEQIFWSLVLLSWVPVINAYSLFPSFLEFDSESIDPILMPEPISWQHPAINMLFGLFIVTIAMSFQLRRRFIRRAEELLFFSDPEYRKLPEKIKKKIRPNPPAYILAALPLAAATAIPYFANGANFNNTTAFYWVAYIGIFFSSVYLYLKHAHIISSAFIIFCLVLLFDAVALYASSFLQHTVGQDFVTNHYSVFGTLFDLYTTDILKVLLFILTAALIRMAYLVYADNQEYIDNTDRDELKTHGIATFKLWYPMLIIFVIFTGIYQGVYTYKIEPALIGHIVGCDGDEVMESEDGFQPNCPTDLYQQPIPGEDPETSEKQLLTLEQAILQTNDKKMAQLNAEQTIALNKFTQVTKDTLAEAPNRVHDDLNNTLPRRLPGTKTRSCGIDIVCLIENGLKSATNSAYVSVKNRQLRAIRARMQRIANDANKDADTKAAEMNELVSKSISQMQSMNATAVQSSFEGIVWLSRLLFIYSVIILLKTFMIVYSRISFAPGTNRAASFKNKLDVDAYGKITKLGSQCVLPIEDNRTYFFARNSVAVVGPPMDRVTPKRWLAFFARIFHGCLSLNRVVPGQSAEGAIVAVDPPAQLVAWELRTHERVFFHFADFAGMSEEITLERRVSLSISTLIFGQMIHYCAVGPGRLYLKTKAEPEVIQPADQNQRRVQGQPSSKLVAWNISTSFDIWANLNVTNTFLSQANITSTNPVNDRVVIDKSEKRGIGKAAGIIQFAKSFLLPI